MNALAARLPPSSPSAPAGGTWILVHLPTVDSTQAAARGCAPWTAVSAVRQSAGRGQRGRTFTSDAGGLYLTAVVPFDGDAARWKGFALAVGRGLLGVLLEFGVEDVRLRWPNDLMIGLRKVGGILVEQGGPRTLLVGLGLNITNRPWLEDPTLRSSAGRLLDHCDRALTGPAQLTGPVLRSIRRAHEEFAAKRLAGLVPELNRCWGPRRQVRLEPVARGGLPGAEGAFAGIDARGQVLLARPDGSLAAIPEHHIRRLIEVDLG